MGRLSCRCLNIKIHTKTEEIVPCDISKYGSDLPSHDFFSDKQFAEVDLHLEGVTTEHKSLMLSKRIDERWTLFNCLNCKLWTHASQTNSNRLLVTTRLITNATEMEDLQKSPHFSSLYRIILQSDTDNQHISPISVQSEKYTRLQETLTTIQQQLNKFLIEEESAMEEKIKAFEQQQREGFARLQSKARRDKNTLISLILSAEESTVVEEIADAIKEENPVATTKKVQAVAPVPSAPVAFAPMKSSNKAKVSQPPPPPQEPTKPVRSALSSRLNAGKPRAARGDIGDFDFDPTFDDTGDQRSFYVSDDDDVTEDTDDSEPEARMGSSGNGVAVGRDMRGPRSIYSSSVPISVPMWGQAPTKSQANRKSFEEEDEDELDALPEHPDDMAASMKALARSVHSDGTEMFGDLPRSRFKTEFGKF